MATVSILNTDANLSGKTLETLENDETVTGLKTYDRDPNPPFAVSAGSAVVPNLISERATYAEQAYNGQLVFPATQNPSANANTLDDYEEGSWTPSLSFGGSASGVTYSVQTGRYTKIGRLVTVEVRITLTSNGTGTGGATITGCPFTEAVANVSGVVDPTGSFSGLTAGGSVFALISAGTIYIMQQTTTTRTQLTETNITDTASFSFSLTFSV